MKDKIIPSSALTDEEKFWLEQGKKYVDKSIDVIESAGKQIMATLTTVNGIYLAAITFSDLMKTSLGIWYKILFLAPFIFWLVAIFFVVRVFKTQKYHVVLISPDSIRAFYGKVVSHKQRQLDRSFAFLVAGIICVIIAMVVRGTLF